MPRLDCLKLWYLNFINILAYPWLESCKTEIIRQTILSGCSCVCFIVGLDKSSVFFEEWYSLFMGLGVPFPLGHCMCFIWEYARHGLSLAFSFSYAYGILCCAVCFLPCS